VINLQPVFDHAVDNLVHMMQDSKTAKTKLDDDLDSYFANKGKTAEEKPAEPATVAEPAPEAVAS